MGLTQRGGCNGLGLAVGFEALVDSPNYKPLEQTVKDRRYAMRGLTWLAVSTVGLILAMIGAACAPQVTPSSLAPPTPQTAPTPAGAAPATPAISLEEAAWAKVVEAAKKEGTVNNYSVTFVGDVGQAVAKAFWDRYGIKIESITGKGAEFLERIKVEQRVGQYTVDVNDGSSTSMARIKEDGLSLPLKPMGFPTLREQGVWEIHPLDGYPEGYAVGYYYGPTEFWVNTKLVPAVKEPASFRDLLQPGWKGKMMIADPSINSAPYFTLISLVNHKELDWDYVKALGRQDLKLARTTDDLFTLLARGDAALTPLGPGSTGNRMLQRGPLPIKPVPPAEGSVVQVSGLAIIKNAPHPNAAKVLLNWMISQEGQTVYNRAVGLRSIRADVPDFRLPAVRIPPKKVYVVTVEESEEAVKLMRERFLPNLWKD